MDQRFPWQNPQQAYQQGVALGQNQAAQVFQHQLGQAVQEVQQNFEQQLNRTAGGLRKEARLQLDQAAAKFDERLANLGRVAEALTATRTGASGESDPGTVRVENIPGKRVPYIALVEIPIQSNDTSIREASWTVTQDGPFVATRRWATFLSSYEFQVTDVITGNRAKFPGRSYGRYRPAHSASDVNDALAQMSVSALWFLNAWGGNGGTVPPAGALMPGAGLALPTNASSFRSMEFDGRVQIESAGATFPRQNKSVPSAWWAQENNGPVELSALDVFERGECITWKVQPNHVNNPPAGNVGGSCVFPNAAATVNGWPFVDGQYDPHEGVQTPSAVSIGAGANDWDFLPIADDPIVRLPDGYIILAYEGYRIIQPPGMVL
jgi:hypothetical protein